MRKIFAVLLGFGLLIFWMQILLPRMSRCIESNSMIHFWGGILAAFLVRALFEWRSEKFRESGILIQFVIMVLGGVFLGSIWEIFEYLVIGSENLIEWESLCVSIYDDTIRDLIMDIFGSATAGILYLILTPKVQ